MTFEEIHKVMEEFNNSSMRELEINDNGTHIHLSKNNQNFSGTQPQEVNATDSDVKQSVPSVEPTSMSNAPTGKTIDAPMVGSVYLQSEPDKPAYVEVGTKVHKGDIVCIIEAMKMMTEIKSEVEGTITRVLVDNEEMVEFGQPLFELN